MAYPPPSASVPAYPPGRAQQPPSSNGEITLPNFVFVENFYLNIFILDLYACILHHEKQDFSPAHQISLFNFCLVIILMLFKVARLVLISNSQVSLQSTMPADIDFILLNKNEQTRSLH